MTKATRKIIHTVAVAGVGVLTDLGAQLSSPNAVNYTRAVVVGLVIGGVARLIGAYLSASAASDEPPAV